MVDMILKAAPLMIMLSGITKVAKHAPDLLGFTKTTVIQIEVNEIAKYMKLSSQDSMEEPPTPENFSDYL